MADPKTKEKEAPERPAIIWPVRIDVGPEMHVVSGKRYGPGIVFLYEADFQKRDPETDEPVFDLKKFNELKNTLVDSVRRTHHANNRRLGIMSRELGDSGNAQNLRPAPIHQPIPDVTGTPENSGGTPPITEPFSTTREHDPNETLPLEQS